jgi:phenylacetate-CoA ligase
MNAPLRPSPELEILAKLQDSEWWDAARIERGQDRRLEQVIRHAVETVPFYRGREAAFEGLPILTRRDLQDHAADSLLSTDIPARVGKHYWKRSSGSTGEPVHVVRTDLEQVYWRALTARDHLWHKRDVGGTLCAIRAILRPNGTLEREAARTGWGWGSDLLGGKGKMALIPISTDPARQARWLLEHDPHYLLSYPNSLLALAEHFEAHGLRLERLREVRTIGETLTAAARERLRKTWNVPVNDLYSTEEVGIVALQCPSGSGLYHVQAESVRVEILDEQDRPCAPGEVGRVVVSNLHNFAMPLLRYDLGDYAEVAGPCPCGRGLPALARILGRRRNMLTMPNGERQWPFSGVYEYRAIAPIRRVQMVQVDREQLEMRMTADRPVTADEERRLIEVIHRWVGYPFQVRFKYLDAFPPNANGKFEDFVSRVT